MENQKQQSLITIEEALMSKNIDIELLNKIKFIITSGYVEPQNLKINTSTGVLFNTQTTDIYEIKHNPNTQEFEIYKNNKFELTESELKKLQTMNKPKVKTLTKEDPRKLNNAAFTRISFLVLNTVSILLLMAMVIMLIK